MNLLNRRIDIRRRATVTVIITPEDLERIRGFQEDFFDVTQDVLNNLKVTLTYEPVTESEHVMLNGLEATDEAGWDYIISEKDIIFPVWHNLTIGDTLRIKYEYHT